jgi:hypothetical protein
MKVIDSWGVDVLPQMLLKLLVLAVTSSDLSVMATA